MEQTLLQYQQKPHQQNKLSHANRYFVQLIYKYFLKEKKCHFESCQTVNKNGSLATSFIFLKSWPIQADKLLYIKTIFLSSFLGNSSSSKIIIAKKIVIFKQQNITTLARQISTVLYNLLIYTYLSYIYYTYVKYNTNVPYG